MNLIGNAFKYTPAHGSISICVNELKSHKEGYCRIKTDVIDTGVGMSEAYLPNIFDSFTREYNTTIGKIYGTGLGMAIVKKLVDMMDGEIYVESELGRGSCFTLILEHKVVDATKVLKVSKENEINADRILSNKHVLLAEDNDLNAQIAMAILEMNGIEADRVEDSKQCVDQVEKMPVKTYDLILMDVQMPNMNGYEATKRIRKLQDVEKANIPILAMTANAFESDKKMALASGMNGHISKPIDIDKVKSEILSILTKH